MSEEINEKPIILITNDDGITAPGIRSLVEAVQDLGECIKQDFLSNFHPLFPFV